METSSEIVFTTHKQGIFTYVNPSFTRTYGFRADEVVGKFTPRILKSNRFPVVEYAQGWKALLAGKAVKREVINKTEHGRFSNCENAMTPILDELEVITGFVAVLSDIGVRKKAGQKRVKSELRMRVVLEAIPDAVLCKNAGSRWLMMNQATNQLMNYPATSSGASE